MSIAALIVAAGRGTRAGPGEPKQYRALAGEPVLRHSLRVFANHPAITHVLAVIHPDDQEAYEQATGNLPKLLLPLFDETESVRWGLEALQSVKPEAVLIHDGARPFVSADLISRVIEKLSSHMGALPALPVTDTLRYAVQGNAGEIVSREELWRAQLRRGVSLCTDPRCASRKMRDRETTDDVTIAMAAGFEVASVMGHEDNFKDASMQDLERAERLLMSDSETRTGMGYDVHRFGPRQSCDAGGLKIAHDKGLVGHSDADVGLHAVTDAILGALGNGDIGVHFPPSDARWKGAASDIFLAHAAELAQSASATISHIDLTFICERPKISPHAQAIRERIAKILHIETGRVSVKATTTEGLGFTGRGEGIAAQSYRHSENSKIDNIRSRFEHDEFFAGVFLFAIYNLYLHLRRSRPTTKGAGHMGLVALPFCRHYHVLWR